MSWPLSIEREAVHALGWVSCQEVLQEQMKFIFRPMLEFLMSHEFFYSTSHRLYVVDDQFIQISIGVIAVYNKLTGNSLTSWVSVEFSSINMLI